MRSALAVMLFTTLAWAGPRDFVVEHSGVGGTSEQAAPYLDQFLRYIEKAVGWPAGSASAQFFAEPEGARSYITQKKPAFGMLDPELYLELHKSHDLEVLVTVQGKNE